MLKHTESNPIIPVSTAVCNKYVNIFWSHVAKGEDHECWLWTGGLSRDGYGKGFNGKTVRAHRLSWAIHYGEIPSGLQVLHDCPSGDNPICVNPAHLWLGTNDDNMADMVTKRRQVMGVLQHSSKLDEEKVRQIRILRQRGETLQSIGDRFGVCFQTISRIFSGTNWKQVK